MRWASETSRNRAPSPAIAQARVDGRALLRADRVGEARAQWEQGLAVSTEHAGILEGVAHYHPRAVPWMGFDSAEAGP